MKVLGIDTSTMSGSIGLTDWDEVISEYTLDLPITHSERLLEAIDLVLGKAHCTLADLDGFAISLGPGSFTGLRIGVSTVKGLAYALQKRVAGISTLDVLAAQISPTPYLICPIIDARKGELYTALYRYEGEDQPRRITAYQAIKPEALVQFIEEKTIFVGNGLKTYGDHLKERLASFAIFSPPPLHFPRGSFVARLGAQLMRSGKHLDLAAFTPLYVRPSEAELKWQQKTPD